MAASTGNIKKIAPFSLSSFLKNKKKKKKNPADPHGVHVKMAWKRKWQLVGSDHD
jgi:hypothetical protein